MTPDNEAQVFESRQFLKHASANDVFKILFIFLLSLPLGILLVTLELNPYIASVICAAGVVTALILVNPISPNPLPFQVKVDPEGLSWEYITGPLSAGRRSTVITPWPGIAKVTRTDSHGWLEVSFHSWYRSQLRREAPELYTSSVVMDAVFHPVSGLVANPRSLFHTIQHKDAEKDIDLILNVRQADDLAKLIEHHLTLSPGSETRFVKQGTMTKQQIVARTFLILVVAALVIRTAFTVFG